MCHCFLIDQGAPVATIAEWPSRNNQESIGPYRLSVHPFHRVYLEAASSCSLLVLRPYLTNLLKFSNFGHRVAEPDGLEFVNHLPSARTDPIYNAYVGAECCELKNLVVCKTSLCAATNLENVTLDITDGDFRVWCFDSGVIRNHVNDPKIMWPHAFILILAYLQQGKFTYMHLLLLLLKAKGCELQIGMSWMNLATKGRWL